MALTEIFLLLLVAAMLYVQFFTRITQKINANPKVSILLNVIVMAGFSYIFLTSANSFPLQIPLYLLLMGMFLFNFVKQVKLLKKQRDEVGV